MYGSYWAQIFVVGLGGFIGSAGRFALSGLVHRLFPLSTFPYGTLAVNVIGCLAIGFISGMLDQRQILTPLLRLFLLVGVLGGFTTFSAFAYETLDLVHASNFARAISNVIAQVVFGLTAAWIGYLTAQHL
ncbi:MAG TPA: fluoride efflux transporter CrcB [Nitrospirales bacterium]|nr:fluoride efflux transporter CrcB [Nitrospirales bacterium]HIB54376.1 fluoride efflux transporter CrcB [Nitrospirales bacterium]HIN32342.1 fluoride efflux transporter CrcB [Nitrospirales bacterium]HIO22224.1 fluoride efflux transporter CrcB [Nitrospirales bacterium]HIO69099.1 fluoride efflux transporter CrcB [Nitrospirales bacterium]